MEEGEGSGGRPQRLMYVFTVNQNLDFIQRTMGKRLNAKSHMARFAF